MIQIFKLGDQGTFCRYISSINLYGDTSGVGDGETEDRLSFRIDSSKIDLFSEVETALRGTLYLNINNCQTFQRVSYTHLMKQRY